MWTSFSWCVAGKQVPNIEPAKEPSDIEVTNIGYDTFVWQTDKEVVLFYRNGLTFGCPCVSPMVASTPCVASPGCTLLRRQHMSPVVTLLHHHPKAPQLNHQNRQFLEEFRLLFCTFWKFYEPKVSMSMILGLGATLWCGQKASPRFRGAFPLRGCFSVSLHAWKQTLERRAEFHAAIWTKVGLKEKPAHAQFIELITGRGAWR